MNENNTHPLTEERAAEIWGDHAPAYLGQWRSMSDDRRAHAVHLLRVAHNAGREHERATNPEDDRPWEPLDEDDPLNVGDEVRRDHLGIITTAVVARMDDDGSPWNGKDVFIGLRRFGTWHVRRTAPTLPTEDGAVIVPADGHEFIETTCGMHQFVMIHAGDGRWRGGAEVVTSKDIVPGTWRAA